MNTTDERLSTGQQKISGYKNLTADQIEMINDIKRRGNELGQALDCLAALAWIDQRWLSIARTQLQLGQMALIRAIAQPDGF